MATHQIHFFVIPGVAGPRMADQEEEILCSSQNLRKIVIEKGLVKAMNQVSNVVNS